MKKVLFLTFMLFCSVTAVMAQKPAQIKFEKTLHDFGEFSAKEPTVTCTFAFTNVGEKPLVINQAVPTCGCTVPKYTKEPIMPGKKGVITVTYNGQGKPLGHFKKSVTVRTNGENELTKLYITGDMVE